MIYKHADGNWRLGDPDDNEPIDYGNAKSKKERETIETLAGLHGYKLLNQSRVDRLDNVNDLLKDFVYNIIYTNRSLDGKRPGFDQELNGYIHETLVVPGVKFGEKLS